jgi:zinc protease
MMKTTMEVDMRAYFVWSTLLLLVLTVAIVSCAPSGGSNADEVSLTFEKYQLDNGLDVILHVDRSDPIVAVAMTFHAGSSREVEGKTGFAHLFEHLFFLDSENLGPGGLDRLMTRVGSSTNGSTSRDRTNYFEVVPVDGLEKTLWAEADKLGFFINTLTESVVAKEKQVVKNEKRQSVDNRPYGHTDFVIDRAIYPEGHPYRWQVIGSLEDLQGAELADIVDFHGRWYGPNNATLVVAGDLDVPQTKEWIEHYFGEIPAREMPASPQIPAVELSQSQFLVHEDNLARLPMLTVAWPSVPMYHADSYALNVLADLLTDGKSSPFYEVLVKEEKVAPSAVAYNQTSELGGQFRLQVRAFSGTDLDRVMAATDAAFARFEETGVIPEELERIKAGYETGFYAGLASVQGKAFQLARYNIFAGDPGYAAEDLERSLAVTAADVQRVYDAYVKDRPFAAASFVPRGSPELALEGSTQAVVVEEPIVQGAEAELAAVQRGETLTPSVIDRSVEPPYGTPPSLSAPDVWHAELSNGIPVSGVIDDEVPLVQFELRLRGGQLLEDSATLGVANLLAESMMEGTATKTPEELEKAIDMLGASIDVSAETQSFVISGRVLARNYAKTMALVEEILLEPRFDEEAFERARQRVQNGLRQRSASPTGIAGDVFGRLLYGDHILANNRLGSIESIQAITLADLGTYHAANLVPGLASFHVAGDVSEAEVVRSLAGIQTRWQGTSPPLPAAPSWDPARAGLYFVDVLNASQSVLRIGYLALAQSDPDYYPATVMNFRLGGGGFASDLTQMLREQRGYTYGIGSGFQGSDVPGPFQIFSNVRANVTFEALDLIKEIVERHGPEFDAADLEATQSFLLRANARAFETRRAKLGLLANMTLLGFPADYVLKREETVRSMTIDRVQELASRYLDPDRMIWLVVGDARTQRDRLGALGLGDPVMLDRTGRPVG